MKSKKGILFILIFFIIITGGCSFLSPWKQSFTVTASEDDAEIYVNGKFAGKGNATVSVWKNDNVSVLAKKKGFFPAAMSVDSEIGSMGTVDIIVGCVTLVHFLGLVSPGAYTLEQANVVLTLRKK